MEVCEFANSHGTILFGDLLFGGLGSEKKSKTNEITGNNKIWECWSGLALGVLAHRN